MYEESVRPFIRVPDTKTQAENSACQRTCRASRVRRRDIRLVLHAVAQPDKTTKVREILSKSTSEDIRIIACDELDTSILEKDYP